MFWARGRGVAEVCSVLYVYSLVYLVPEVHAPLSTATHEGGAANQLSDAHLVSVGVSVRVGVRVG